MQLSLILPAYQAEGFIADSLERLLAFLEERRGAIGACEVIVVDDGSRDGTGRVVAERFPDVVCLRVPHNAGKGNAVRQGMLTAQGEIRVFIDCDLPYELEVIEAIVARLRDGGADVCIGARDLAESSFRVPRHWARRLASAIFTLLVSQLVLRGFRDSQCGVKGYRAEAAEHLFRRSRVDGFAFDVEILYLAHKRGYRIEKVPVRTAAEGTSSIRLVRDSVRMLVDTLQIPLRYHAPRWLARDGRTAAR